MSNQINHRNNIYEEIKCIWMASDVVNYKLCDREFDCENCQFDKVMQNLGGGTAIYNASPVTIHRNYLIDKIDSVLKQPYDPSCYYLNNNMVVKHLFSNTYYLGVSCTVMLLLDNLTSVCECKKDSYVLMNDPIFNFSGDWGSIAVRAPMNFMFLEGLNTSWEESSVHKWLAIVAVHPAEISPVKISEQDWYDSRINIANYLKNFSHLSVNVGTALNDRSEQAKYLYQFIGKIEYQKLLRILFQ